MYFDKAHFARQISTKPRRAPRLNAGGESATAKRKGNDKRGRVLSKKTVPGLSSPELIDRVQTRLERLPSNKD